MNIEEIQVYTEKKMLSNQVEFWVYQDLPNSRNWYNTDGITTTITEVKINVVKPDDLKPFLSVDYGVYKAFKRYFEHHIVLDEKVKPEPPPEPKDNDINTLIEVIGYLMKQNGSNEK